MSSRGRIEKFNSTAINAGNTQATSVNKELTVARERCQCKVHDFSAMVGFLELS